MYRYDNIGVAKFENNKSPKNGQQYYLNNVYPDIPATENDLYVICTMGDRLDLLAYDFYGDSSYWWIIASANSLPGDSLIPPIGYQLRIPGDFMGVLTNYERENERR